LGRSSGECGTCSGRFLSRSRGRLAPMIENPTNKRKSHMNRINFSYSALVLVVTGFAVSLTGCGQKQELDPRTQPELVRIVEIGSSSGADPAFTGVVSARVQSNLGFRVPGKITSRLVDTGQFVRAGTSSNGRAAGCGARPFGPTRGRSKPAPDVEAEAGIEGICNPLRQHHESSGSIATAFWCC